MLYVFFGKDSFSLRERLDELRTALDADGMLSSSTSVLDGRRATLAEVTAACDTVPFMCAHRLGIVEGLLSRARGGGGGAGGEAGGGRGEGGESRPRAERAVSDWIRARAKSTGLELSAAAARLLAGFVRHALWGLSGGPVKLCAYPRG